MESDAKENRLGSCCQSGYTVLRYFIYFFVYLSIEFLCHLSRDLFSPLLKGIYSKMVTIKARKQQQQNADDEIYNSDREIRF